MCVKTLNGLSVLPLSVTPDLSQLTPLPEKLVDGHLYGLAYTKGFKQFSQNNGYLPWANQSYTPDSLGLLNGQIFGQPLTFGSGN